MVLCLCYCIDDAQGANISAQKVTNYGGNRYKKGNNVAPKEEISRVDPCEFELYLLLGDPATTPSLILILNRIFNMYGTVRRVGVPLVATARQTCARRSCMTLCLLLC